MLGLIILSSFLIPIILAIAIILVKSVDIKNKDHVWNIATVVGATLAICAVLSTIGYFIGTSNKYSNEIWHYKIVKIRHEMQWTTHETRTYQEACGTERYRSGSDNKGKPTYSTRTKYVTKTKHYTETHGPYFYKVDEYSKSTSINNSEYETWRNIWRNENEVGMHRGSSAGFDRRIDGPIYECNWNKSFDTIYPYSDIHSYVNKVRASKFSVMRFKEADETLKNKYPLPADTGNTSPVINYGTNFSFSPDDTLKLNRMNANLGPRREIHCMFVLFDSSKNSVDSVSDVLSAWQGVNKNELVTFIGVNGNGISWVKCESWMDNTMIHGMVSDQLMNQKLTSDLLVNTMNTLVPKYWFRKQFVDFDYLRIEISIGSVIFSVIGHIVVSVIAFFVFLNINNKSSKIYNY